MDFENLDKIAELRSALVRADDALRRRQNVEFWREYGVVSDYVRQVCETDTPTTSQFQERAFFEGIQKAQKYSPTPTDHPSARPALQLAEPLHQNDNGTGLPQGVADDPA